MECRKLTLRRSSLWLAKRPRHFVETSSLNGVTERQRIQVSKWPRWGAKLPIEGHVTSVKWWCCCLCAARGRRGLRLDSGERGSNKDEKNTIKFLIFLN